MIDVYKNQLFCMTLTLSLVLVCGESVFSQRNFADDTFIDNADQFSETEGVRLGGSSQDNTGAVYQDRAIELTADPEFRVIYYDDPNQVPTTKKSNKTVYRQRKSKKRGFSFSDMASGAQKRKIAASKKKKESSVKEKSYGFSFSELAGKTQRKSTANKRIK